jgi:hypothetical protein
MLFWTVLQYGLSLALFLFFLHPIYLPRLLRLVGKSVNLKVESSGLFAFKNISLELVLSSPGAVHSLQIEISRIGITYNRIHKKYSSQ